MTEVIRIYVACLASYNNGVLFGRWIDAEQSAEDIWDGIEDMLSASSIEDAEEWAIHDYEGFDELAISEYDCLERVSKIAHFISEHGKLGVALIQHFGSVEDAEATLTDDYRGVYSSLADYAQELTEETADIPDSLRSYIDCEKMARDMAISDVFTVETRSQEVHVFSCN